MTAEQALIEENKKDPRVRYITSHCINNTLTDFWSEKPFYNGVQWIGVAGSLIISSDSFVDFGEINPFILCIDDINQDIPPIPEKWYIECTEDNRDILNGWRLERCSDNFKKESDLLIGETLLSENLIDESFYYAQNAKLLHMSSEYKDYQEITLEQFKKYVLCEGEEKQEEKTIENHPIMSIAESELFQKEKLFIKNDTSIKIEQTIFYSTRCWIEDRINYINKFIRKNIDSDLCIPIEWVEERNELIEKLKNL